MTLAALCNTMCCKVVFNITNWGKTMLDLHEITRRAMEGQQAILQEEGLKMTVTLSLRVPTETIEQLGQLAEATGKSRNFIAVQAMQDFIEREAWQVAEIRQAIEEADAGEFATDEAVNAMRKKWSRNAG